MFRAGLSASSSKDKDSVMSQLRRTSSSFVTPVPSDEDVEDESAAPATEQPSTPTTSVSAPSISTPSESPRRRVASSSTTPLKAIKRTPTHRLRTRSFAPVSPTKSAMSKPAITTASAADSLPTVEVSDRPDSIGTTAADRQNVVVCVRVRPGGDDEEDAGALWSFDQSRGRIVPTEAHPCLARRAGSSATAPGAAGNASVSTLFDSSGAEDSTSASYEFCFDSVVLPSDTTDKLYSNTIAPIVRATLEGFNGTVFAYGQTGSGKTHTMSGSEAEPGVIPRAVQEVFDCIAQDATRQFLLRVSYLEIYNESLRDLLSPLPSSTESGTEASRPASPTKGGTTHIPSSTSAALRIVELEKGRVSITGLREELVTDPSGVIALLEKGQANRHVGATDWNERSSRSHCVFTITVESCAKDAGAEAGKEVRISQLNLIDLAGSERAATSADRRKEGAFINKSLLTLGTVIAKLTERSSDSDTAHIPYRDSKLTRLLQNSLGGNARVAVLCTLSPRAEHAVESLSTLKFGKRCKMVVTAAKRGTVMDDKALLERYRRELNQLRARLEGSVPSTPDVDEERPTSQQTDEQRDALARNKQEIEKDVETMRLEKDQLRSQIEHLTRLILTSNSVVAERDGKLLDRSAARSEVEASVTLRRGPRMSDMGVRSVRGSNPPFLGHVHEGDISSSETSLSFAASKPFAMEAELAALRKDLAGALKAKQASDAARRAEMVDLQARLEAEKQELEDELEVAHEAFMKVKSERGEAIDRAEEVEEEREAALRRVRELEEQSGLLKLISKSRESREGVSEEEVASRIAKMEEAMMERVAQVRKETQEKESAWQIEREELQAKLERELGERQQRDAEIVEFHKRQEDEIASLQQQLKDAAEVARPLPVPSVNSASLTDDNRELKRIMSVKEAKIAHLEAELANARAAVASTSATQADDSAPNDTVAGHMETVVELQMTVDEQKAAIQKLEKDLQAEQQKAAAAAAAATAARAKPLPVPKAGSNLHSPSSPSKLRESTTWGSAEDRQRGLEPTTPTRDPMAFRGGSLREYKRYSPSSSVVADVFSPGGASVLESSYGPPITSSTIAAAVKAEREEIGRLNSVIHSQRSIIADLERSVADWQRKISVQNDLIRQLDEAGGLARGNVEAEERVRDGLAGLGVSFGSNTSSPPFRASASGLQEISMNGSAWYDPAESTELRVQRSSAPPADSYSRPTIPSVKPYYGAHTYNRALSGAPTSPTKSSTASAWQTPLPHTSSPRPLPLPSSPSSTTTRRTPRKTIESEMRMLRRNGGGSVQVTRDKLLDEVAGGERRADSTGRHHQWSGSRGGVNH